MEIFDMADSQVLLQKLHAGDHCAFETVFSMHYRVMYEFANQYIRDPADASDVVEECFVKLYENRPIFNDLDHLRAYLYRTVRCRCIDHMKTSKRTAQRNYEYVSQLMGEGETDYLTAIIRTEAVNAVWTGISNLPPRARTVMKMLYVSGDSHKEVAEKMGITVSTVKAQRRRALSLLRKYLAPHFLVFLLALGGSLATFTFQLLFFSKLI